MAVYEYACDVCGDFLAQYPIGEAPETEVCAGCGAERPRRYSIKTTAIMHEHWNITTQSPVSDNRKFKDILARQAEEASERTGIEHDFQPIDPADAYLPEK